MKSIVFRNSISNTIAFIATVVVMFFITPFMVQRLGKSIYGVWSILVSLTGYFGLLDFGIRSAIVKYVSQYQASHNYETMNRMNSTTQTIFTSIGILSWIAMVGISFFISKIFNIEGASSINFTTVMSIVGLDVFLTFYFIIYKSNIAGYQRYDIIFLNSTISLFMRAGLLWYFLCKGHGIVALSLIVMTSNLMGDCLNYIALKLICREVNITIGVIDRQELKKIFLYSIKSFITNISDRIIYNTDCIIIGIFLNAESVTYYTIASSLIVYLRQLVLAICGVFIPAVSEAESRKEYNDIYRITINGTKLILFALVPIFCGLMILGNDFIRLWMGEGFEITYQIMVILLIGQFIVLSQYGVAMVLYGIARHGLIAKASFLAAILNLILDIILVQSLGLIGVAIGSALSMFILQLILIPMYRMIKIEFHKYFIKTMLPFMTIGFLFSVFLLLGRMYFNPNSWLRFSELVVVSIMFYLFLCFFLCLSNAQRSQIKILLEKWRGHKVKANWLGIKNK